MHHTPSSGTAQFVQMLPGQVTGVSADRLYKGTSERAQIFENIENREHCRGRNFRIIFPWPILEQH